MVVVQVTIEDPFDQQDWANWSNITADAGIQVCAALPSVMHHPTPTPSSLSVSALSSNLPRTGQIVGDDLTCTNPELIKRAIDEKAANCLLLKVNQIGSITVRPSPSRPRVPHNHP